METKATTNLDNSELELLFTTLCCPKFMIFGSVRTIICSCLNSL